jgi:leucyl-tRNA synthetase
LGAKGCFEFGTISWLKEWACSREYGLGTKLPFDERYLIESLSDSTIYMAYYTFAHILQNGNLQGDVKNGPVKPVDLTKSVWDYIFVDGPYPEDSKIEKTILNKMKHEFLYWYGVDLRTSGKDLIQNHLTMFLYNHAAIFPQKNMPKAIFANGHVLVDGEKMSKSKGNFLLLGQTIKDYSCDATRIALADAGDGLEDANFLRQTADDSIVRLTNYLTWVQEMLDTKLRTDGDTFADKSFEHRMRQAIHHAKDAYANMKFRDALRFAWYDFQTCKDDYKVDCDVNGMRHDLVMRFIELQCVIMAPITPHVSQHVWGLLKKDKFNSQVWPVVDEADIRTLRTYDYYRTAVHGFRVKLEKEEENWKKKNKTPFVKPEEAYVYICVEYSSWQKKALGLLREIVGKTNEIPKDIAGKLKPEFDGKEFQNVMTFVSFMKEEFEKYGISSLGDESPNDEVKILSENVNMMTKTLGVKKVTIYASHDKNIVDPSNRAPLTSTGKPQISFVYPTTK